MSVSLASYGMLTGWDHESWICSICDQGSGTGPRNGDGRVVPDIGIPHHLWGDASATFIPADSHVLQGKEIASSWCFTRAAPTRLRPASILFLSTFLPGPRLCLYVRRSPRLETVTDLQQEHPVPESLFEQKQHPKHTDRQRWRHTCTCACRRYIPT